MKCPHCGGEHVSEAKFCTVTGKPLEMPAQLETREVDQLPPTHQQIPPTLQEIPQVPAVPNKRGMNPWLVAGLIAAVLGCILVTIGGVLAYKGTQGEGPLAMLATATNTRTSTPTPTATPTLGIGSNKIRKKDDMPMVFVPAGIFYMGSEVGLGDEKPVHAVFLNAFWIDQYEVTNAQFTKFVEDTEYTTEIETAGNSWIWDFSTDNWAQIDGADWQHPNGPTSDLTGLEEHPVVQVSWNDAVAYCEWAGGSLPTEAQWEKAARGGDARLYPWGNILFAGQYANGADINADVSWADLATDDGYALTAPVGSYPQGISPYGAYDMGGNVWEWVADWWNEYYYQNTTLDNPTGPTSGDQRGLRGGSWLTLSTDLRATYRVHYTPTGSYDGLGFRCMMAAEMDGEEQTGLEARTPTLTMLPTNTATATPTSTPTPLPTLTPTMTPTTEQEEQSGFREKDGMEMVLVPAGSFLMGSDTSGYVYEEPQHLIYLDTFWIDKYDVSNAQYALCVAAGACTAPSTSASASRSYYYGTEEFADYPVIHVGWSQADSYCQWVDASLPTEAQWEKAARGTDGREYPWGNEAISCAVANYKPDDVCIGDTVLSVSYPGNVSPYGAVGMAGNVWNWVLDWFSAGYYSSSPYENPTGAASGEYRILRGGSWGAIDEFSRTAYRAVVNPEMDWDSAGFRCVVPME